MDSTYNIENHFVSPEVFMISQCIKDMNNKRSGNKDDITSPESKSRFRDIVAEVFDPFNNACTILLGQCAVIQRLGLRW